MRRVRVNIKSSIAQVFGRNIKSAFYVLLILFLVSWAGDLLLSLTTSLIDIFIVSLHAHSPIKEIVINLILLLCCFFGFMWMYQKAQGAKRSDGYDVTGDDKSHQKREVMIMTLSPYSPVKHKIGDIEKESHKLDIFLKSLDYLKPGEEINKVRATPFNCNWLPPLQAISHYPSLKKVIVLGTSSKSIPDINDRSKMKNIDGSFKQIKDFKKLVEHYFQNSGREIEIIDHNDIGLISKTELKNKCSQGVDADSAVDFAEITLEILDSLDKKHEKDSPLFLEEKVIVDVTSGKSSMSASLAAASGSKGIFLHYTDTHTMKSHVLDVNTD